MEVKLCTIGTGKKGKTRKDVWLVIDDDQLTKNGFKGADMVLTDEDEPVHTGNTVVNNVEATKGGLTVGSTIRICRVLSKHSGCIGAAVVQMLKERREELAAA